MPFGRLNFSCRFSPQTEVQDLGGGFGLLKMLPWPGGKKQSVVRIVKLFPDHKVYVEPFAGGATMFFHKVDNRPSPVNVIADTDCDLIRFYKGVAKGALRRCRHVERHGKGSLVETARRIWKKKKSKSKLTPCEYLMISKASYGGNISRSVPSFPASSKSHKKTLVSVFKNLDRYEDVLRKAKIYCADFEKVMKKHDGKDTLFYLDPPYIEGHARMYEHEKLSPERIKKVILKTKGKVMLSYNWSPTIERIFCKDKRFHCASIGIGHQFGVGTHWKRQREKKELLITNFPLRKTRRSTGASKRRAGRRKPRRSASKTR